MNRYSGVGLISVWLSVSVAFADRWVDSTGTGDGSSNVSPTSSLQDAITAASAGETIYINGDTGRLYTNKFYLVNKSNLTLRDWVAKPIFRLTGSSDSLPSTNLLEIAASSVKVQNLRFEVQANAIGAGDNIIGITTNGVNAITNTLIEGCEFVMTASGGVYNQGAAIAQLSNPAGSNTMVRKCTFANWLWDSYRPTVIVINGNSHAVVGNVFTNCSRAFSSIGKYSIFSSNRVYSCSNTNLMRGSSTDLKPGIIAAVYNELQDSEISHNLIWNNGSRRGLFLFKFRTGFNGNTRIFNNTIYNADSFMGGIYASSAEQASPKIYNNLLINNTYTNIYSATNGVAYKATTEIKNNLFFGGMNQLVDPVSVGVTPVDCYNVSVTFVDTNDTSNIDFLRPDANKTPQVLLGIGGAYPSYIGALVPKKTPLGTMVSFQ